MEKFRKVYLCIENFHPFCILKIYTQENRHGKAMNELVKSVASKNSTFKLSKLRSDFGLIPKVSEVFQERI